MEINTFKRYEKKYLLSKEQYDLIIPRLVEYMNFDEHCINNKDYSIYSIYYDTYNNDVIRHSISKPYYKEKLRLRSYTTYNKSTDKVFLELKKKINGIVNKRRVVLTLEEANNFIDFGIKPSRNNFLDNQVINEIEYYLSNNKVKPAIYIGYNRKAFFAKENNNIRVTFDSCIITRRHNITLEDGCYGDELLGKNKYLMEIKILGAIPIWLTNILTELKIYNIQFSKYGNEFIKYIEKSLQR